MRTRGPPSGGGHGLTDGHSTTPRTRTSTGAMERFLLPLFLTFHLLASGNTVLCVVLVQESSSILLPLEQPAGAPFFRLVALDEATGARSPAPLFQVLRASAFRADAKSGRGLFTVDSRSGALMLSPHRRHALAEYRGLVFGLDVAASSSEPSADGRRGRATVVVTVANESAACRASEELCFPSPEIFLQLPETARNGTYAGTLRPATYARMCPQARTSYAMTSEAPLSVSESSGDLLVSGELDFESRRSYEWNVSCSVDSMGESAEFRGRVLLSVLDVDDNPPRPQGNSPTTIRLDAERIVPGEAIPARLSVLDRDSSPANNISVGLLDPLRLFDLRDPVLFHDVAGGGHMLLNAVVQAKSPFQFPGTSYNISVIFEDRGLVNGVDNKVVFRVEIYNHSHLHADTEFPEVFQVETSVFRRTAHHARVVQPMEVHEHAGYFFRLSPERRVDFMEGRILAVTPNSGIVYVRDEVALSRYTDDVIRYNLTWRNKRQTDRQCRLVVHVLDTGDPSTGCGIEPGRQFETCALHGAEGQCHSSCGRGAPEGFCQWRPPPPSPGPSSLYATCSPHLDSCPDGRCDELEQKDPLVCPQDCANKVQGEAFRSSSGRGIGLSASPCTCDGRGTCTCVGAPPPRPDGQEGGGPDEPRKARRRQQRPTEEGLQAVSTHKEWRVCDAGCRAMIGGVSLVMAALVSAAALVICRQLRGGGAGRGKEGALEETLALGESAVPAADCGEEGAPDDEVTSVDPKLEFPRGRLVLGEVLGEGEFGRVVKARATDIADIPGEITVAVKMLKEGASPAEERDLLSELNLLKEVSHPNIVRLLGACSLPGGPLYVIVEFAEHGSLESHLRKRRAETLRPEGGGSHLQQELFSFSWQIAKGMAYLADMKLVHRDLAARNVLLASGKVVKISDFGLSRDVYVGDAYFKTTKSRVPVKWMAIESLADHVYTTKSDVWSFGIVLWEIISLGASPYPGIGPERLYHLLKGGYRMPKPEDCSQELYRIMVSCWRESPQERPSFKDLVQRLEAVLHDTVEYLPLGVVYSLPAQLPVCEKKANDAERPIGCRQSKIQMIAFSRGADSGCENRRLLSPDDYPESV